MANAFAEKVKGLALRHGEKAGVALASMVFLVCVGMAASRPTIATTPEQIKQAADASDKNLNRREEREAIIKRLEEDAKITDSQFAKTVEDQSKFQLVSTSFTPARAWVTPEPGAGLIRDTPKLIAPTELYAYPGRGGLLVYALDEKGERIPLKEGEEQEKKAQKFGNTRKPRAGGGGGMGGMMGGMGGATRKRRGKSQAEQEREAKEERERLAGRLKAAVVGSNAPSNEPAKSEAEQETQEPPGKEITKGYRWVAITGVLDHEQMLANYREALKNPSVAHPYYKRLDLQRKSLQPDESWSDWQDVDANKNYDVLDNLPEHDEELAPENVLPEGLIDPLPFLKAGLWEKVHIASLVPKEKRELPPETPARGMMGGMGGGMPGMMGGMGGMDERGGGMRGMMGGMRGMMGSGGMPGMMGMGRMGGGGGMRGMMEGAGMPGMAGGSGMMGMMGGMMGGTPESAGNYWKSEEKRVMIRALDFTAEPDHTYQYRVRIVVYNPNYKREDVSPGVKTDAKELAGPWSKETDLVTMPPDVMPYATGTLPASPRSDVKVRFQVVRFNPATGWTIPRTFEASAGEIIGELRNSPVPASDGSGQKSIPVDFSSHQIVLDVDGGGFQQLPSRLVGTPIERPALALLLRPDGSVVVHNEADDVVNEVRKDIESNYRHELAQSNQERKHSAGSGYAGMMGSMMGGMMGGGGGGGYGGMMMRRGMGGAGAGGRSR